MNTYRRGDRVRIVRYSKELNGKLGFVTAVSGSEVYVRPRWRRDRDAFIQLYAGEVEPA